MGVGIRQVKDHRFGGDVLPLVGTGLSRAKKEQQDVLSYLLNVFRLVYLEGSTPNEISVQHLFYFCFNVNFDWYSIM